MKKDSLNLFPRHVVKEIFSNQHESTTLVLVFKDRSHFYFAIVLLSMMILFFPQLLKRFLMYDLIV